MAIGVKQLAVWFQADQRSAGIPYRRLPSHSSRADDAGCIVSEARSYSNTAVCFLPVCISCS